MTEQHAGTPTRRSDVPVRLRAYRQPSMLPDWMRDPPPPRRTLRVRVGELASSLPGAGWLRRHWWSWQQRERLYQRYPKTVKIVAMVVSWVAILIMVSIAYALYGQA